MRDLRFRPSFQAFTPWSERQAEQLHDRQETRTASPSETVANLVPDRPPASPGFPTEAERDFLLRRLTPRDVAILTALDDYRYLDQAELEALFFPSPRTCQLRTAWLRKQGLVHRWLRLRPQTWRRLPSVLALSLRGAWLLAVARGHDPHPAMRRSRHALAHRFHLLHDLEANGFFVELAATAAPLEGEGLYHWIGDWGCRETYRARGAAFAPDGWGRYLTPSGEVALLLEWDRGTESPQRVGLKASQYVAYFSGRREAQLSNVLFVVPNDLREASVRRAISDRLPPASTPCCTFSTTTVSRLREDGPLGSVWLRLRGAAARSRVADLPAQPRTARDVADSICKPGWWLRRPGGGERA